jgi:pimeloyl-ACP methyl ester carboxylesterase
VRTDLHVRRRDRRPKEGPLVVFVHGSMDRGAAFTRAMAALPDLDSLRYDRRGYGASYGVGDLVGLEGHVDDLLSIVDGRPAVLVGHSYGGLVSLVAACRAPELVLSVGAFEAPMPWEPWWPPPSHRPPRSGAEAAERFLRKMLGDATWEKQPRKDKRLLEGDTLLAEQASLRTGRAPFVPEDVPVPVVAGCGTESEPELIRSAEELAARVPEGELVVVEGADHGAHTSHPAEFAAFAQRVVDRAR